MIPVVKPFLPQKNEFDELLSQVWERCWLTNNGPLVNALELNIKDHLGVDHLLFVTNGTIALQIAIKVLDLKGEIITTPFSYVATTSSIVWEGCTPIFVDLDANSWNIDAKKIEEAVTPQTSAILATHVYGNPCDIETIENVAAKYNLKVIYDAAHCFGTKYKGQSVLNYGDISTISFHATKLFHTVEGGAVITKDPSILKSMSYLRNFGHDGPLKFSGVGINGKNSEFHAAMGLANLKYIDNILARRKTVHQWYDTWLDNTNIKKPLLAENAQYNYSYYPVLFESEEQCEAVFEALEKEKIYAKRYFYPLLSDLEYVENSNDLPVATDIVKRVLCLPLYFELSRQEVDMICRVILRILKY